MPRIKPATELELALARALFRSDKWDPARDQAQSFEWEPQRNAYVERARRLLRTFEKDGLELTIAAPPPDPIDEAFVIA